jgi:hypothetical protein
MADRLEPFRSHVMATILHATDLLADLTSLDEALETLHAFPAALTETEREALMARLCGYDEDLPERLSQLVESLADLVAGLTSTDGVRAWLQQRMNRLAEGETAEAA